MNIAGIPNRPFHQTYSYQLSGTPYLISHRITDTRHCVGITPVHAPTSLWITEIFTVPCSYHSGAHFSIPVTPRRHSCRQSSHKSQTWPSSARLVITTSCVPLPEPTHTASPPGRCHRSGSTEVNQRQTPTSLRDGEGRRWRAEKWARPATHLSEQKIITHVRHSCTGRPVLPR